MAAVSMIAGMPVMSPVLKQDTMLVADAADTGSRIRVDINKNDGRKASQSKNAYNWILNENASDSYKVNGVTFKLSNGGSVGGNLSAVNNKKLQLQSMDYPRLNIDGAKIKDGDNGGVLKLEISGLSGGEHSLQMWHSNVDGKTNSTLSISVNGKKVMSGVKCPTNVTNDNNAGISYVTWSGSSVTILISPDGNGTQNVAWLNAFELDGSDPINGVSKMSPGDQENHLNVEDGLSWAAGKNAKSHNVYIGTSYDSVFKATTSSAEFMGNQTGTTYALDDSYSSLNTYYWRVDEVDSSGNTVKGAVYSFKVNRLAFPTAEGYGRFARGGRGGYVYHVTNLKDDGKEGSLRYGIETLKGARTIVFDVGGIIELNSKLTIPEDGGDLYVAGQTAPGDGICLTKWGFGMLGPEDVIIRDVRVRVGDRGLSGQNDVSDGMGLTSANNSIIDHCSISWATDEGFSSRNAANITFQWNIIGESLHDSIHYGPNHQGTETHAFAASISGYKGSFHHNLLIDCTGRNWSLAGGMEQDAVHYGGACDIRNNVVYNWYDRTTDGGVQQLNFVNNYYKMGAVSKNIHIVSLDGNELGTSDMQKMYVSGNVMMGTDGNYILKSTDDAWSKGKAKSGGKNSTDADVKVTSPFFESYVNTQSAEDAYNDVIVMAGANAQGFDYIDSRYQKEVKNGTYTYTGSKQKLKGILDSQKDAGGYPTSSNFKGGTAPKDSDRDGISDAWESAHGLNPNDASDGAIVTLSGDDYTNLEMYLNELAGDPVEFNGGTTGKRGTVMDTTAKYEITNAATGALLENSDRWTLTDCGSGYYQIISTSTGKNLSGDEQYKFVKSGDGYIIYTKSSEDEECVGGESTVWKLTAKLDPIKGSLIKEINVLDTDYYADWAIDTSISVNDAIFGDRTTEQCAVSEIPSALNGAELVLTPCNAKASNNDQAELIAAQNITLYVGLDSRVTNAPSWLSGFTKTDMAVKTSNDVTFMLYSRSMSAGDTVMLGANGQSSGCMNYIILASNGSASVSTGIKGDVNADGSFDVADVVLLQRWLLAVPDTHLPDWRAADMCEDDRLNVFDLCLMKRELIESAQKKTEPVTVTPYDQRSFSFSVKSNLFNQNNNDTLGLSAPAGVETVTVWKASSSGDHYCNGVCLEEYKGKLYCQWQSSATDEDSADTHVMYAVSSDKGKTWSTPRILAQNIGDGYCTSGGWLATEDKLVAYINFWDNSLSVRGGYTYYMTSADGMNWTTPAQVKMADGTPLNGIFEQDPHVLKTGMIVNAAHFQPGLFVCPIYTDDPTGVSGWKKGSFTASGTGTSSVEMEPSIFVQSDDTLCMIFRDQNSSYKKLISYSLDDGATWSKVQSTDMPDARTKQSAGNLSDGTAFMAGCPVNNNLRSPLAITLSKDGKTFDTAFLLRSNSSDPALVYEGKAKKQGFHYCKSLVANGNLYVGYATNKETVEITIIPESSLS